MSEDFQTTAPAVQQTAADKSTATAIDAYISGDKAKAATAFRQADAARAAPSETGTDPAWRDDSNDVLPPMPDNPEVTSESDAAVTRMAEMGGSHTALLDSWGSDAAVNVQFARSAFAEIAASDPTLIAAFDRAGLGDSATIIDHLAKHGRLAAGLMNDRTIERRNNDVTHSPIANASRPRNSSSAQNELDKILEVNPPGSQAYKNPKVQARVEHLYRMIAGSRDAIVGQGGRTA
jgi:hypothetical protein